MGIDKQLQHFVISIYSFRDIVSSFQPCVIAYRIAISTVVKPYRRTRLSSHWRKILALSTLIVSVLPSCTA